MRCDSVIELARCARAPPVRGGRARVRRVRELSRTSAWRAVRTWGPPSRADRAHAEVAIGRFQFGEFEQPIDFEQKYGAT